MQSCPIIRALPATLTLTLALAPAEILTVTWFLGRYNAILTLTLPLALTQILTLIGSAAGT